MKSSTHGASAPSKRPPKQKLIPGKLRRQLAAQKPKPQRSRRAKHRVRYLTERETSGNVRYYWQPSKSLAAQGWTLVRLPDDRSLAVAEAERINAELDAWRAANSANPTPQRHPQSVGRLIKAYQASPLFKRLRPKTQKNYAKLCAKIDQWIGGQSVQSIRPNFLAQWYHRSASTQLRTANAVMTMLSILFAFACERGQIWTNPVRQVRRMQSNRRDQIWSDEAICAVVAAAQELEYPSIGTAVIMAASLAQRQGDLLTLRWTDYSEGKFLLRQSKTRKLIEVPALDVLAQRLANVLRQGETILINEASGRPYTTDAFGSRFRQVREHAIAICPELEHLQFLDLRRTAIVRLGEAGCTETEVAAISGHSIEASRAILETYMPRTSVMAGNAIAKLTARRAALREVATREQTRSDRRAHALLARCAVFDFDPLAVIVANSNLRQRRSLS